MAIAAPTAPSVKPHGLALIFGWRRVRFVLIVATIFGLLLSTGSQTATPIVVFRAWIVGAAVLFAFGLLEQWPRRLPNWIGRWVLQLIGIMMIVPWAAFWPT
jgi:hypothetical protein